MKLSHKSHDPQRFFKSHVATFNLLDRYGNLLQISFTSDFLKLRINDEGKYEKL